MNKRLAFLEKMTADGSTDPMAWYGLALEYKNLERWDDARKTFETLRGRTPDYVPMYLMAAQMFAAQQKNADARTWAEEGMIQAKKKGDSHALSELEQILTTLS